MPIMSSPIVTPIDHHDPSTSNPIVDAFRVRCNTILRRLFPEDGVGVMGDWNHHDALELIAIFDLARLYRLVGPENALLSRSTILRVLTKLVTAPPFYDYCRTSLFELECSLRLIASALRLYKYEGTTLRHEYREALYKGINTISSIIGDDKQVNRKMAPMPVERENIAFLVKHCQYLLISIDDVESLAKTAAKKAALLVDGVANGYGGQYVEAKKLGIEAMTRQRLRPKWHDEFMRLEDDCFGIYARGLGIQLAPATDALFEDLEKDELAATFELRNGLEDRLVDDHKRGKSYNIIKLGANLVGKATEVAQDAGPYEQHLEYFHYGILDLAYQLTFRVRNRKNCFKVFVRIVRLIFEWTHQSAHEVQGKAADVYERIQTLGQADEVSYGTPEDNTFIRSWLFEHRKKTVDVIDTAIE
jgi:hypothetical protein